MKDAIIAQFDAGACRELLIKWDREAFRYELDYHDIRADEYRPLKHTTDFQGAVEMAIAEVKNLQNARITFNGEASLRAQRGKYYLTLPQIGYLLKRQRKIYLDSTAAWLYEQLRTRSFTINELSALIRDKFGVPDTIALERAKDILNNWVMSDVVIR